MQLNCSHHAAFVGRHAKVNQSTSKFAIPHNISATQSSKACWHQSMYQSKPQETCRMPEATVLQESGSYLLICGRQRLAVTAPRGVKLYQHILAREDNVIKGLGCHHFDWT